MKISNLPDTQTITCRIYFMLTWFRPKYEEVFAYGCWETVSQYDYDYDLKVHFSETAIEITFFVHVKL